LALQAPHLITFSATNTSVGELLFNAGAPAYSFNITNQLFITGTGIVNNSSNRPSITNGGGDLRFTNTSTAGNATITNNNGGGTQFFGASTAGNGTIMTNTGGFTEFFDTSTGGNARFITNAGGIFDISMLNSGDDDRLHRGRRHLPSGFEVAHRWKQ
jgi:hypothetical protein